MSNFDTTLHILDVSLVFSLFLEVDLLLLTAQPWAERGSCSTRGLLTARPWAELGSWFTRGFFFSQICLRPDPSFRSAKF